MKRIVALIAALVCVLGLVACDQRKNDTATWDLPPLKLTMNGVNYLASATSIAELPDDFEYMGEITDKEANDTGLQGCKYYANKYLSSFDEFYVYQECETAIGENTDTAQSQWAYVKWVREGFYTTSKSAMMEMEDGAEDALQGSEAFSMVLDENTSLQNHMGLSDKDLYWQMVVENTGNGVIIVEVGGDTHRVEAGKTVLIYSASQWSAGTYTVSFAGYLPDKMHGKVVCYVDDCRSIENVEKK